MNKVFLSVILPVKNEEERLPITIADIDKRLVKFPFESEIVVASYGSTDNTSEIVRKMSKALKNLKLVISEEDQGIGSAVRQGLLLSSGEIKLVTNINNSVKIDEFEKMQTQFGIGAEVVLGKRVRSENFITSAFNNPQIILTGISNLILQKFFFREYSDPTTHFCAFTSHAAEKIFSELKNPSRFHQLETLKNIKKSGLKTKETEVLIS